MAHGIRRCTEIGSSPEAGAGRVGSRNGDPSQRAAERIREPHLSLVLGHFFCSSASADCISA
jgi:hypothetical protein